MRRVGVFNPPLGDLRPPPGPDKQENPIRAIDLYGQVDPVGVARRPLTELRRPERLAKRVAQYHRSAAHERLHAAADRYRETFAPHHAVNFPLQIDQARRGIRQRNQMGRRRRQRTELQQRTAPGHADAHPRQFAQQLGHLLHFAGPAACCITGLVSTRRNPAQRLPGVGPERGFRQSRQRLSGPGDQPRALPGAQQRLDRRCELTIDLIQVAGHGGPDHLLLQQQRG